MQPQSSEEGLGHSALVEISAPRPHRQSNHRRTDGIEKRRACKKQILNSRGLKNAIIGSMKQKVDRWKESRYADSRAPRRLVHHESVMIEPQPCADVPLAQAHLVLQVNRRFDIPFRLIRKLKV